MADISKSQINEDLYKFKQQWAIQVVNTAKANLLRFGKINTGRLRDSIRFIVTPAGNIRFFYVDYGKYVESGRRPNDRQPPINPILRWIEQKGITPRDGISKRSLAYIIARSIGEDGIRPAPFMTNAIKSEKKKLTNQLKKAIGNSIKKRFIESGQ